MAKVKILVVEDEAITAKDLQNRLKELGYDVPAIAASGEGAIKKVEEIKPDLVLMDIILNGDMDGIGAAEQIRDRFDIPVIYVTAYLDEERLEKTKVSEPYGYILKPFGDKDLRPVIEMALQRHKLEKALRESEAQKQALLDGSPDMIMQIDRNMKLLWANKTALDMNPDAIGQTCHKAFVGLDEPCEDCPCKKAIDTGQIEMSVKYQPTAAGVQGESYWEDIGVPLKDRDGRVVSVIEIARNVTERKQAEEKQKLFSHALDSSIDGLAMGDLEGKITYVNDAFVRMFGYSREELIWNEISFIYPEDQLPKLEKALKATMAGGWIGELVGKRKNGELFPIAISSSLVKDDEGNAIAHMASFEDISERKRAEEELKKKNEELEQFNRLTVGRELKMIELKKEINGLLVQLGEEPRYKIAGEGGR